MTGDQGRGPVAASKTGLRFIYCSSSTFLPNASWEPINLGWIRASIARSPMDPGCAYISLIETNPRGTKLFIKYGPRTLQDQPWGAYCHLSFSLIGKPRSFASYQIPNGALRCTFLVHPKLFPTCRETGLCHTTPSRCRCLASEAWSVFISFYSLLSSHCCFPCSNYLSSFPSLEPSLGGTFPTFIAACSTCQQLSRLLCSSRRSHPARWALERRAKHFISSTFCHRTLYLCVDSPTRVCVASNWSFLWNRPEIPW